MYIETCEGYFRSLTRSPGCLICISSVNTRLSFGLYFYVSIWFILALIVNDIAHAILWYKYYFISKYSTCFVCLDFVPLENFSLYGDVTITDEGCKCLTHTRHSWPLRCEDSLACHTYCVMGQPFIVVISEDPWPSHLLKRV